jgi:hypothetical protein
MSILVTKGVNELSRFTGILMVGLCVVFSLPATAEDMATPAVEVANEKGTVPVISKTYDIAFQTSNLNSNQVIKLFIETEDGAYIPIPESQVSPRTIPINQFAKASVELRGIDEEDPVRVSFFALDAWDARMISRWMKDENQHAASRTVRKATKLGSVHLN